VTPTLRGIGVVPATSEIQIDRYSISDGVKVSYLDAANPHAGWKTAFGGEKSWVRFNEVDFGRGKQKMIEARASGQGVLEIRLDKPDGPVLARVKIGDSTDWRAVRAAAKKIPAGVHDLIVTGAGPVEVDWISFR
jgi:hypothetical protein